MANPAPPELTKSRRVTAALTRFTRPVKLLESLVVVGSASLGALAMAGWTVRTPSDAIAELRRADSVRADSIAAQGVRLTTDERRLDAQDQHQQFEDYMLCTLLRRSDPSAIPPSCNHVTSFRP